MTHQNDLRARLDQLTKLQDKLHDDFIKEWRQASKEKKEQIASTLFVRLIIVNYVTERK